MAKQHVSTTINGEPVEYLCEPQQTLLDVLRDELNLTGSKEGCSSGDCGACTVIVDGNIVCSCLMLGAEAEGRKITTIEGIAEGDRLHPVQQKFRTRGAAMRLLHARLHCRGKGLAGREFEPHRGRDAILAGRQSLPLYRL
jgi:carbon-monoxide dehydrogenase small subunit